MKKLKSTLKLNKVTILELDTLSLIIGGGITKSKLTNPPPTDPNTLTDPGLPGRL